MQKLIFCIMLSYDRGKFVKTENLIIKVNDDPLGFYRGYRIFTACRTVNGKVFALNDHINRLFGSAKIIKMPVKEKRNELEDIINLVVKKNYKGRDLLLEIVYTGGISGKNRLMPSGPAKLIIAVYPFNPPPPSWYKRGISLATYPFQRLVPEAKITSFYAIAVMAHMEAAQKYRAQEVLYIDPKNKTILEGTTFNFFVVDKKGIILTYPLDGKILPGITRKYVLKIIKNMNIPVKEKPIIFSDLISAREAFLTSSTRNALPVVRVDNIKIGSGQPGRITSAIQKEFNKFLKKLCR